MKRIVVALAIALLPLTVTSVLAATNDSAERPKICFVFGPWKYCI
jgi:hypothetical protein